MTPSNSWKWKSCRKWLRVYFFEDIQNLFWILTQYSSSGEWIIAYNDSWPCHRNLILGPVPSVTSVNQWQEISNNDVPDSNQPCTLSPLRVIVFPCSRQVARGIHEWYMSSSEVPSKGRVFIFLNICKCPFT